MKDPLFYILEGTWIYEGEGEQYSGGTPVVGLGDVSEPLLASSIPDLHFDGFVLVVDDFGFEIDSDGGGVAGVKSLIGEACDEGCLAYSSVSDD